jgi:hypothetical protein
MVAEWEVKMGSTRRDPREMTNEETMEPHGQSPWYLHEIPAYAHRR